MVVCGELTQRRSMRMSVRESEYVAACRVPIVSEMTVPGSLFVGSSSGGRSVGSQRQAQTTAASQTTSATDQANNRQRHTRTQTVSSDTRTNSDTTNERKKNAEKGLAISWHRDCGQIARAAFLASLAAASCTQYAECDSEN